MVLITKTISDFPVFIYNLLTYMGVSRTHLQKLPSGRFITHPTTGISWIIYAGFHVNSWCKGLFLIGLFAGVWNLEMEFFDYIAGLSYLLIFIEICIGDWLLMRTYPYFEILTAGLKLQNEIHLKLGPRAEEFRGKQNLSAVKKVWFQWIIILMGIAACILNYASAPKYCIFTNAIIKMDTPLINWLMGFHDVGFIVNAWMLYGADIAVQSVFGGQFQHCLSFMADEVRFLTDRLDKKVLHTVEHADTNQNTVKKVTQGRHKPDPHSNIVENKSLSQGYTYLPVRMETIDDLNYDIVNATKDTEPKSGRVFQPVINSFIEEDHEKKYTIDELIMDYRKLGIYAERMNNCCSYNFLAIHIIAYIQMTCDVFVIFQLLRMPGSQPSDVAYFIEDCIVCMYLLYKCFKSISFVGDKSDEFHEALERYTSKADPRRNYHRKIIKSLPKVVMKLGPSICGPSTVGNACMILMNYYIMVALW